MIIVTGATGNVGRPLVAALTRAGHTVTAVARGSSADLPPAGDGVVPVRADLAEIPSMTRALTDAAALFLLVPGAGAGVDGPALMELAAEAGVRRVVLLSSQAVSTRPGTISYAPLAELEDAVRASGLEWTILRPGGLASNALTWAPSIREHRRIHTPYAGVALPIVDPLDVAEAAATVLTGEGQGGRSYLLTGPASTTPRERAAAIAAALGESVEVAELTHDQARAQMLAFMPEPVVDGTLDILGHPTAEEQQVGADIADLLGRPARPFAEWAARNVAAFR